MLTLDRFAKKKWKKSQEENEKKTKRVLQEIESDCIKY